MPVKKNPLPLLDENMSSKQEFHFLLKVLKINKNNPWDLQYDLITSVQVIKSYLLPI